VCGCRIDIPNRERDEHPVPSSCEGRLKQANLRAPIPFSNRSDKIFRPTDGAADRARAIDALKRRITDEELTIVTATWGVDQLPRPVSHLVSVGPNVSHRRRPVGGSSMRWSRTRRRHRRQHSGSKKSTGMLYHFPGLMGDRPGGSDTRAHSALSDKLNSTLEN